MIFESMLPYLNGYRVMNEFAFISLNTYPDLPHMSNKYYKYFDEQYRFENVEIVNMT